MPTDRNRERLRPSGWLYRVADIRLVAYWGKVYEEPGPGHLCYQAIAEQKGSPTISAEGFSINEAFNSLQDKLEERYDRP